MEGCSLIDFDFKLHIHDGHMESYRICKNPPYHGFDHCWFGGDEILLEAKGVSESPTSQARVQHSTWYAFSSIDEINKV